MPPNDRIILRTVGAGLGPLSMLGGAERPISAAASWWLSLLAITGAFIGIGVTLFLGLAIVGYSLGLSDQPATGAGAAIASLVLFFAITIAILALVRKQVGLLHVVSMLKRLSLKGHVGDWLEMSARLDPVSGGPLLDGLATPAAVVGNSVNPFRQHIQYQRNPYVKFLIVALMPGAIGSELFDAEERTAFWWSRGRAAILRLEGALGIGALSTVIWWFIASRM